MTGKELKELREKYGLTQKNLAEAVETEQAQISRWENELYGISRAYQKLLKQYFEKYVK